MYGEVRRLWAYKEDFDKGSSTMVLRKQQTPLLAAVSWVPSPGSSFMKFDHLYYLANLRAGVD